MKILQIFNRYSYIGGEEIAVEQISKELGEHHEFRAITFDSQEWVSETGLSSRIRQFLSMAWNPKTIEAVRKELVDFKPDVVLLHNIMPIGSAGLYMFLTDCGIPVVHFIHNFRPFSVNGYCWGNGKLLPQGLRKNFLPEVFAGSWQNSRFKTAWYGLLIWSLHRLGVYKRIDGWIAISNFMRESFIQGGIAEDRIAVISHSWQPKCTDGELENPAISDGEPVFLFLGRLTEEKGLRVLLDAWEIFEKSSPNGQLKIAGDGPLKEEVRTRCETMRNASYLGFQSGEDKTKLLRSCTALVVPSIWWEPSGLVLYEAYDFSKPVLAARSGGIVDHVEDGVTGWIHEPGDAPMLATQMLEAKAQPQACQSRGRNGRAFLLKRSSNVWIHEFNEFVGGIIAGEEKIKASARPLLKEDERRVATACEKIHITAYLADQNPGHDRSFGISRMSQMMLHTLQKDGRVSIDTITSKTSQQAPSNISKNRVLPWGTRRKSIRFLTDHLHPLLNAGNSGGHINYFPKGYLPLLSGYCKPSVVTIHDTIIQYDEDHYPEWRKPREYAYWAMILKNTLKEADLILTVSESSKHQIQAFMKRHRIPPKEITVTYEPCLYEELEQPLASAKENYVIHLASVEPHKRTAHLVRWWHEAEREGRELPALHLIGCVPMEVSPLLASARSIVKRPFLEDAALQTTYREARALILPSEIEGFGLPALEAYYLGTPVCFIKNTSVEEILSIATDKGAFTLEEKETLFSALDEVMAMSPEEIRECGLKLRETYAAKKVAEKMVEAFREVATRKR